jgi:exosome complex component CSL4
VNKNKVFVPGEIIAVEEEYSAGKNVFEENGYVKSAGFGIAEFDENNKEVSIKCKNISNLKENDIVFGRVVLVKDAVAVLDIVKTEEKRVLTVKKGQIPVRFASNNYVTNMKKLFKIADLVRAKVISANDLAVDLSTQGEGLGVVNAYCSNCRSELEKSDNKLLCFNCGSIEERKWFEDKDVREERDFRRNNNFNKDSRNKFGNKNDSGNKNNSRNNFNSKNSFNRRSSNNKNF